MKREEYQRLMQIKLSSLKGEMIPTEDLLSLAASLKINVHGQTAGKTTYMGAHYRQEKRGRIAVPPQL